MQGAGYISVDASSVEDAARALLKAARELAEADFPPEHVAQGGLSLAIQAIVRCGATEHGMADGVLADGLATALGSFAVQCATTPLTVITHIAAHALDAARRLGEAGVQRKPMVRQ